MRRHSRLVAMPSKNRLSLRVIGQNWKADASGPSPDEGDAVALTFAEPVRSAVFRRRIEYPNVGLA
jgi:hypothetical protein